MSDTTLPQGVVPPAGDGLIRLHGLELDVRGVSEQGPRPENQDAFSADHLSDRSLIAVADGMGGERSGRLAAEITLGTLLNAAPVGNLDGARHAVRAADAAVVRAAEENPEERAGMGCALGVLALAQDGTGGWGWIVAHVGDVRVLSRAPDGTLRLETRDHTPAFARWEAGEVALDGIPDSPGANRLQRAVGRGGEADAAWIPLAPGWCYAIVSDGVSKAMRLDELEEALAAPSAAEACARIVHKVRERGPDDNYTAVVVRVGGGGASLTLDSPNPPPPVTRSRTPVWSWLATLLSVVALGLGGFAAWLAWQNGARLAPRAEVVRLEARLDSLAAVRPPPPDSLNPFAPATPADTTLSRTPVRP